MKEDGRREFTTAEDAFRALPAAQQEHGIRVAEYLRVLFLQACSVELYAFNVKASTRLKESNADLMEPIGRYHDLGKALVAEQYHTCQPFFSPEETALYRKHPLDSGRMVKELLGTDKTSGAQGLKYVEEAVLSHHEQWDGAGFPEGAAKENISILARLLAVADALDHAVMEKHSERPMDFAIADIQAQAGQRFDPEVAAMLPAVKGRLKRVFQSHAGKSRAIPGTEPVIKRAGKRPFALWYRGVYRRGNDSPAAYLADIRFRNKREWMDYDMQAEVIRREKMGTELGNYMLLEACDTLNRLDACRIPAEYIGVELPTGWLNRRGLIREFQQLLQDGSVRPERLAILVGPRTLSGQTGTMLENLKKIRELGCPIVVSGLEKDKATGETVAALSASVLVFTGDWLDGKTEEERKTALLKELSGRGVELLAMDVTKHRLQPLLNECRARYAMSMLDAMVLENELVERELAIQNGETPPQHTQIEEETTEEPSEPAEAPAE